MNFLDSPIRRKFLFASLYLSEGAPIGFLWLALPTRLRDAHVPLEQITWLAAVLVIPWTFKFAWAPLIDLLRTPAWTFRHWIIVLQAAMGMTLLPLFFLDPVEDFHLLSAFLIMHAVAAATQDVAIDGLCISVTQPGERGQYNGWMQTGMLLGRAALGGGALIIIGYVGWHAVVSLLIATTMFSALLVISSPVPPKIAALTHTGLQSVIRMVVAAATTRNTWIGLAFGLFGGAAFKSLEVIYGPFLIDRGYSKELIGVFSAVPMIIAMILGSLLGGVLADLFGRRKFVALSLAYIAICVLALAGTDYAFQHRGGIHLFVCLVAAAFGIGQFTAALYALFMDLTDPRIAATQFSAFMGSTNGCEAWSSFTIGKVIAATSYPTGMVLMAVVSLISLPLLLAMHSKKDSE